MRLMKVFVCIGMCVKYNSKFCIENLLLPKKKQKIDIKWFTMCQDIIK